MHQVRVAVTRNTAAERHRTSGRRWLRRGALLLVVGTGPLLLIMALAKIGIGDPNPNPVGLGMLALFTFWPSNFMIIYGAVRLGLAKLRS